MRTTLIAVSTSCSKNQSEVVEFSTLSEFIDLYNVFCKDVPFRKWYIDYEFEDGDDEVLKAAVEKFVDTELGLG